MILIPIDTTEKNKFGLLTQIGKIIEILKDIIVYFVNFREAKIS